MAEDLETQARRWATEAIAEQGANLVACKNLLMSLLVKDVVVDFETLTLAHCTPLEVILVFARVVAMDQRDCGMCLGVPHYVRQRLLVPLALSAWVEQQAVKAARQFICKGAAADTRPVLMDALAQHCCIVAPRKDSRREVHSWMPLEGLPHVGVEPSADRSGNGALVCAAPVPAFSPLLRVKASDLFSMRSVAQYCALGVVILQNADIRTQLPHDEVVLLMCFVFEVKIVGADKSHWRRLIEEAPQSFPTVPLLWSLVELAELDGLELLDDVLAKKNRLASFAHEIAGPVAELAQILFPESSEEQERMTCVFGDVKVLEWAQAVFDSRAFNLNDGGRVVLVLAPVADMVNHDVTSDILTKRLDHQTGDFEMETGAALTADDVGRELVMSYGPLQNWELLQSYGFVLEDNDNERLPFPLAVASETSLEDADEFVAKRKAWEEKNCLHVAGAFSIPRDGVPPPALVAYLRLQQAEGSSYPHLQKYGPFVPLPNPAEEATVWQTVRLTVQAVLDVFPTTLEYDEACLAAKKWLPVDVDRDADDDADDDDDEAVVAAKDSLASKNAAQSAKLAEGAGDGEDDDNNSSEYDNEGDDDDDGNWEAEALTANDFLCLRLRIGLKRIAYRALEHVANQFAAHERKSSKA
jgi:hypothetical protein